MQASKLIRSLMKPDTKAEQSARIARRLACEKAHAETIAKFGSITAENAAQAIAWQEKRIQELSA